MSSTGLSAVLGLASTVYCSRAVDPYLTNIVASYLLVRTAKGYAEPLAKALPLALAPDNPGSVQVTTTSQLVNLQAGINSDLARPRSG